MASRKTPALILFDVNETLLDLSPLKQAINSHFEKEYAAKEWFLYLLQYSLVEMATDQYHNFSEIGDAALQMLGQSLEKDISADERREILAHMAKLQPHKDVEEGLLMLKEAGFRLATLTNSAEKVAAKQLEHAGIASFFEARLSVDSMRMFKPKLHTYRKALKLLSASPEETLFVAAHGWDITGAQRAGLSAAFIGRPGQALYPLAEPPAYQGKTLPDIARQLLA